MTRDLAPRGTVRVAIEFARDDYELLDRLAYKTARTVEQVVESAAMHALSMARVLAVLGRL